MSLILLHGGGDHPDARAAALGPLVAALPPGPASRLALVVCEGGEADRAASVAAYRGILGALCDAEIVPIFADPDGPLQATALQAVDPAGIFVCGGATPFYHAALCHDTGWLSWARAAGLPFAGTSAGAAVAAEAAIVGGWQAARAGRTRAILFSGAAEGLDELELRPGLGLVAGAIDVHASQWGTLLRLIHAVELGRAPHGWAIDENTALVIEDERTRVVGAGQAYRVEPGLEGGVHVRIVPAD